MSDELPSDRRRRLANQAALAAARLQSHRTRCSTCARGSGFYDGLCVLGISLRREAAAARELSERFPAPSLGA